MTHASRPLEGVSLPASRGRILVAVLLAGSIGAAARLAVAVVRATRSAGSTRT